jgi:hypothetical protein
VLILPINDSFAEGLAIKLPACIRVTREKVESGLQGWNQRIDKLEKPDAKNELIAVCEDGVQSVFDSSNGAKSMAIGAVKLRVCDML